MRIALRLLGLQISGSWQLRTGAVGQFSSGTAIRRRQPPDKPALTRRFELRRAASPEIVGAAGAHPSVYF
jgi:hypothetical protein